MKAFIGPGNSGAFSTEGRTELRILSRDGKVGSDLLGKEANYNPALDLITLINDDESFSMFSLKDEKLSSYRHKQSLTQSAVKP